MSTTLQAFENRPDVQRLTLPRIGWSTYVALSDDVGESSATHLIYREGRLTFVTKSRLHDWFAECLGELVKEVAEAQQIPWEFVGSATLRRPDLKVGVEGDKSFYIGPNAERMLGPKNIDLSVDPVPDLAIEVEVSHAAEEAMRVYARLGVPEVWRLDVNDWTLEFQVLQPDATYSAAERSLALPMLAPPAVLEQLRQAEALGSSRWTQQLRTWSRVLPRLR